MKKFDFYEFAGVLAPGAVALYGLARIYPDLGLLIKDGEVTFGELGLLLILAYVAGHLIQSLGNLIEWFWWKLCGGWPSDWVRTRKHNILAAVQWNVLPERVRSLLRVECPDDLETITKDDWKALTRQVYSSVRKTGRSERIDIFNGNYGMFRGIAASLVVIIVASLIDLDTHNWRLNGTLAVMLGLALLRMHRFGVHYGRELFVQFIGMEPGERAQSKKEGE